MKSTKMKVARFLPLIALLVLAPFGPWSCTDAGDEPGSPTGPVTVYDPGMDYPGATVVVTPASITVSAGDSFTVVATYRTADGVPVSNAPLQIVSEAGAYLSTPVNPSYTDDNGKVSFLIAVDLECPPGSYRVEIGTYPASPLNGPFAGGTFGLNVN